ncbi:hypothetical protein NWFMUON74_64110 [Nocardia wallacei]|uniref:Uncharacterized protein n=1 Tax=Nocardia wallacei TaxID=480035 RepID=A0A7G1KX79_9NOCA|nr:hypothetical protein NWFMUON74_64110 [Nocardia wallacei]
MIETAASVGPYRLCTAAPDTDRSAATVSGGSASPMTNTSRSVGTAPAGVWVANTVSIDGTKSVTVTRCAAMVSAMYRGSRWPSWVATTSFAPARSGMK